MEKVDAVLTADLQSGKEEVRHHRKELTGQVARLRTLVYDLHKEVDAKARKTPP